MKKDKSKEYFVVLLTETDGEPEVLRLCGQSIRELANKVDQESFAILEGNLIKGTGSKIDLSKL